MNNPDLPELPKLSELVAMLSAICDELEEHFERAIGIGIDNIDAEDHLIIAALRRALDNVQGMVAMIDQKNLFCGMPIVRFQIDTAMTMFGRHLVTEVDAYVAHMMEGHERRKYRDRDGKQMTDAYLHEKLTGEHEHTSDLYSYSSGFVHFSNHHLHQVLDLDHWKRTGELRFRSHDEIRAGWTEEERRGALVSFVFASQIILSECEQWQEKRWPNRLPGGPKG